MPKFNPITNLNVLNEAYDYPKPSCFSRGLSYVVGDTKFIYISGTASINNMGDSLFEENFEAQAFRSFMNVQMLLESEGASWRDVIKTTVYIKDINLHYDKFNIVRKDIFETLNVKVFPASTCVQATLCRPELMIEMDAIAIVKMNSLPPVPSMPSNGKH